MPSENTSMSASVDAVVLPLDAEQKAVIDAMPLQALLNVVSDMKSGDCAITTTTFFLAMHPAFRQPNATPAAIVDYCLQVIKSR